MPHRVLLMISSMRGGGSEQQTLLLLRHLDRSLFEPHLYVTQRSGELLSQIPEDVTIEAFDDVKARTGFYYPGRALRQQVKHVRDVLQRYSIDVLYDRTYHMTMVASGAADPLGLPRLSTIVSPPEYALPTVESRFIQLKRNRLARAYRQSRAVVAVSKQAARSAERYYRLADQSVHVIHNPVDEELLRRDANAGARPQRDERLTLVCVGRMTIEKGHQDLLQALRMVQKDWPPLSPGFRVWMIGNGPLLDELKSQSVQISPPHQVDFLGVSSNPAPHIASADGLILPSHFEGLPNVVLEAMALGTPVIATRCGGTIELERDKPTIQWAKPNEPRSLANAILSFAVEREAARLRAANASELVARFHCVGATTRRIERLLCESLSRR